MIEASTLPSGPVMSVKTFKDLKETNQPDICQRCKRIEMDCYPNDGDDCDYFEPVDDKVHHPNHYCQGGIECIKAIEASMMPSGFQDYCKGNILKYIWRWREKAGVEDLKKARVYLDWLIESAESGAINNG